MVDGVPISAGDFPGSKAEDPVVYVHMTPVQVKATTTYGQSKFNLGNKTFLSISIFGRLVSINLGG